MGIVVAGGGEGLLHRIRVGGWQLASNHATDVGIWPNEG